MNRSHQGKRYTTHRLESRKIRTIEQGSQTYGPWVKTDQPGCQIQMNENGKDIIFVKLYLIKYKKKKK